MELTPPPEVWEKLASSLDEINADNLLAQKLQAVEIEPLSDSWKKIKSTLDTPIIQKNRPIIIPIRRFAYAAAIIGLVVLSYFLFINRQNGKNEIVTSDRNIKKEGNSPLDNRPVITETITDSITRQGKDGLSQASIAASSRTSASKRSRAAAPVLLSSKSNVAITKEELKEKIFNEQIDDLSLIASNDRYLAMVNADGRMVKLPTRFSNLAPYLQDKSTEHDYLDILFEESTYWKEKFREWRQKLAQSSISPSVDNFFDIIGLMKSIQDK